MAIANQPTDPAQLGADQSPETSRQDDSRDMSPVIAETDKDQSPDTAGQHIGQPLGSDFDQQRRQGAAGSGNPTGDMGQGQGHTAYPKTPCITDAVNAYLIDLTAPQDGLTCPA